MGKPIFAQLDHDLHNNPKVRKAGRDARDVFVFVLCKNASRGFQGWIPAHYLEVDYLSDQLGCTEAEAANGVARAIEKKLIAVDGDVVSIVGWSAEYGRGPLSNAERQRRYRENKSAGKGATDPGAQDRVSGNPEGNQPSVTNERYALRSNESNASDQIRSEQNRERARNAKSPDEPATPEPEVEPLRLTPDSPAPKASRNRPRTNQPPADWAPPAGWLDEDGKWSLVARSPEWFNASGELERFRDNHAKRGELIADWAAAWRTWVRNAIRFHGERAGPPPRGFQGSPDRNTEIRILKRL